MVVRHRGSGNFIFGGVSSDDLGLIIDGSEIYTVPERDVEQVEVPGRNGSLLFDNGRWKNVSVSYSCLIKDFEENYDRIRSLLLSQTGYQRLEDSYQPDRYRMAQLSGPLEPAPGPLNLTAQVTIAFNCKPQVRRKSGDDAITVQSGDSLENSFGFPAAPLIRVYGYGTLYVGHYSVIIADYSQDYIDIDCETMDAYHDVSNLNNYVTVSDDTFPLLLPGVNGVRAEGSITSVEITPRWWTL